jgi:CheY-like chemotaxis protein
MAGFFENVEVAGFLAKPCEPDVLLGEVRRILAAVKAARSGPLRTTPCVLVGEDEAGLRERLLAGLRRAGFTAEAAVTGPALVERAITLKPDVVLVKLIFSGMNGDAAAAMLHDMPNTRGCQVVLYDDSTGGEVQRDPVGAPGVRDFVRGGSVAELVGAVTAAVG